MNNHHRGQIVKRVIKSHGYKLKNLAAKLRVSRGTLYKYFNQADLSSDFIIRLGNVIKYNFQRDIPNLVEKAAEEGVYSNLNEEHDNFSRELEKELVSVQKKYYEILEEYTNLLYFLVKVSTDKNTDKLNTHIRDFIKGKEIFQDF